MRKIKIYSDTDKGCIFFDGSRVNPKFIGTIIASIHPTRADRIIIKRTDRFQQDNVSFRVLFGRLNIARLQDRDGNDLVATLGMDRDAVVNYINEQANDFQDVTSTRPPLTAHPDFTLDATSTTIMVDNGESFGVNTLKAILGPDGLVDIVSSDHSNNSVVHYEDCPAENLKVNGAFPVGGPQDVVNALNELFTVGAFESVVVADPHATLIADVGGASSAWLRVGSNSIDPDGADVGGRDGGGINSGGIRSTVLIDQPGEYFTFDLRRKDTYGMGLIDVNETSGVGAQDKFCDGTGNYAEGFKWSQWLHSSHGYAWTMYGSDSRFSYGPAWSGSNDDKFHTNEEHATLLADGNVKFRVGIDANSFIHCDYYDVSQSRWVRFSRSSYAVVEGSQFALGIKFGGLNGRLASDPLAHLLEPAAPVMNFRYIESPDGSFDYPLFATAEEANYFDTESGGLGESHVHVYVDDPTATSWNMPDTGGTMGGASAPDGTETFMSNPIVWTEIASLTDSQLAPSAYSGPDYNLDEGESVNIQTQPMDTAYVTTFSGLPEGLSDAGGGMINGTTRHVFGDQTYPVTVTRTNSHGSSSGSFNIVVTDNVAQNAIPGYTIHGNNPITESPDIVHHYSGPVNLDLNQLLFPGTELIWTQQNGSPVGGPGQYLQIGIADPGVDKATTVLGNQTTDWQLKATIWTGTLNHNYARGWDNNSTQSLGNNDNVEWKLSFPSDNGVIELYRDGVLVCTSTDNYSGNQTVTVGVPGAYSTTTRMPSVTRADVAFTGDPPAGFTLLDGAMDDASTLGGDPDDGVVALDLGLEVGKRIVIPNTWADSNVRTGLTDTFHKGYIGIPKTTATWGDVDLHQDFDAVVRWEFKGASSTKLSAAVADGSANANHATVNGSGAPTYWNHAIEWDGTDLVLYRSNDLSELLTKSESEIGGQVYKVSNYTAQSGTLPLVMATKSGGSVTLNLTGIQVIDTPAAPVALLTDWDHAIDFSGNSERMEAVNASNGNCPLRQTGNSVSMPNDISKTSNDTQARPWATSVVFQTDGNASDQFIWVQSEGAGSGDDNIGLKVNASNELSMTWGRDGSMSSKIITVPTANGLINPGDWYGLYIDFNGFKATSPTVSELASAFRIKFVDLSTGAITDVNTDWDVAARNTRTVDGNFYVGGRGANKSFHGKVAAMVVTTLPLNESLPSDAEIAEQVRDPKQWLLSKEADTYTNKWRAPSAAFNNTGFAKNDTGCSAATKVWIMGDGAYDNYSNMIRNITHPTDQNYGKLNMISMLSNDIQTVNIPGLTD